MTVSLIMNEPISTYSETSINSQSLERFCLEPLIGSALVLILHAFAFMSDILTFIQIYVALSAVIILIGVEK